MHVITTSRIKPKKKSTNAMNWLQHFTCKSMKSWILLVSFFLVAKDRPMGYTILCCESLWVEEKLGSFKNFGSTSNTSNQSKLLCFQLLSSTDAISTYNLRDQNLKIKIRSKTKGIQACKFNHVTSRKLMLTIKNKEGQQHMVTLWNNFAGWIGFPQISA